MNCQCVKDLPVIKFSRENDRCVLPSKEEGDAGYDMYIDPKWFELNCNKDGLMLIGTNETMILSTGIRSTIPNDYYAQIQERGSTGIKAIKYGAGVVDASYRGIWNIVVTNCSQKVVILYNPMIKNNYEDGEFTIFYPISKAIAQMVLLPVPKVEIQEVTPEEILNNTTNRMEGKFGSTGK